jgi:GT2 family glycosyltransferase
MQSTSPIRVSVIIPVRNDAERLRRCLESIRMNEYPPERVEVIVMDNGSVDGSGAVAAGLGAQILNRPHGPVALLRNDGAHIAQGEFLAFIDADHVIAPGWIKRVVDVMERSPQVVAVGALCQAPSDGTWVQHAYDRLRGRNVAAGPAEWLGAGNLAVRRSTFLRCGGFDSTLDTCEDVDLCKKLRRAGGLILTDPELINIHFGDPETLGALFRGELWRGRSNLAVSLRRPIRVRELPSIGIPVLQLFGLMVALGSLLLAGKAGVAAAAAALSPLAVLPAARAARMAWNNSGQSSRDFLGNAAVAYVYDTARALALVAFARHSVRRP